MISWFKKKWMIKYEILDDPNTNIYILSASNICVLQKSNIQNGRTRAHSNKNFILQYFS